MDHQIMMFQMISRTYYTLQLHYFFQNLIHISGHMQERYQTRRKGSVAKSTVWTKILFSFRTSLTQEKTHVRKLSLKCYYINQQAFCRSVFKLVPGLTIVYKYLVNEVLIFFTAFQLFSFMLVRQGKMAATLRLDIL